MKLIVFGANGRTGKQVVRRALAQGHDVTAFVRPESASAMKEAVASGELRTVTGDIFDVASVESAVAGHDAVICALGSSSLRATTVRSQGTQNIVRAMQEQAVARLLVVSAMGVGESWPTLSWVNKLVFATLLYASRRDHEAQEAAVKQSGLDWTIVRPSGLTDDPSSGGYEIGERIRGKTSRISRADVAKALVDALETGAYSRTAVTISD